MLRLKYLAVAAIAVGLIALTACQSEETPTVAPTSTTAIPTATTAATAVVASPSSTPTGQVMVTLRGLGEATTTQAGTATLVPMGEKTQVNIDVKAGPTGVEQPIHIHSGPCDRLGGIVHPLNNVVNGKSTTEVNATLASIVSGSLAINLHKSTTEIAVYTTCGDIGTPTGGTHVAGRDVGARRSRDGPLPAARARVRGGVRPPPNQYSIKNFTLPTVNAAAGITVTWLNEDNDGHTVTSGMPGTPGGKFDSPTLRQGEKFSSQFKEAGDFEYFCRFHPTMTGLVGVSASTSEY